MLFEVDSIRETACALMYQGAQFEASRRKSMQNDAPGKLMQHMGGFIKAAALQIGVQTSLT